MRLSPKNFWINLKSLKKLSDSFKGSFKLILFALGSFAFFIRKVSYIMKKASGCTTNDAGSRLPPGASGEFGSHAIIVHAKIQRSLFIDSHQSTALLSQPIKNLIFFRQVRIYSLFKFWFSVKLKPDPSKIFSCQ